MKLPSEIKPPLLKDTKDAVVKEESIANESDFKSNQFSSRRLDQKYKYVNCGVISMEIGAKSNEPCRILQFPQRVEETSNDLFL